MLIVAWMILSVVVISFMAGASIASRGPGRRAGDIVVVAACLISFLPWEMLQ